MANNNILSFFRNAFRSPTRSTTPFGNVLTQSDSTAWKQPHTSGGDLMARAAKLPSPYPNGGYSSNGAALMARAGALPSPYAARGATSGVASSSVMQETAPTGGSGYAMPDLSPEAWAIVNAAVAKQKAANQAARDSAMLEFEQMKREYDLASQAEQGAINKTATDDRAKLNNMMASRGIGAGEAAAMNFGRFDEATQGRLAQAIAQYNAQTGNALRNAMGRVSALDEQDRLLDSGAPAEAMKVLQQLQDSELNRASTIYGMNQDTATSTADTQGMWASIGTDAVGGASLKELNAIYGPYLGTTIEAAAAAGDPNAQRILQTLEYGQYSRGANAEPPASGGYTNLRTGAYTPPVNAAQTSGGTPSDAMQAFIESLYSTPYSKTPDSQNVFALRAGQAALGPSVPVYRAGSWFFGGEDY